MSTVTVYQEMLFCRYRHFNSFPMCERDSWPLTHVCVCVCMCVWLIVTWCVCSRGKFIVRSRKSGVLVGSHHSKYCIVYHYTTRSNSCVMTARGGHDLFPPSLYPSVRRTPLGSCTSCMSWPRGMRHSITWTVRLWTRGGRTQLNFAY